MNKIIKFSIFSEIDNLIHGFSTKHYGNMRPDNPDNKKLIKDFSQDLSIDPLNIVSMQQVHGKNVEWVTGENRGWKMLLTDGLITDSKNVFLSVLSADCVPVMIVDPVKNIVSIIHAGWKGIYNEIIIECINSMKSRGCEAGNLIAGIGPCIRGCCYKVGEERVKQFSLKFEPYSDFIKINNGEKFIDLPLLAVTQLLKAGVLNEKIEDCGLCTFENENFYSYRREGEQFGEIMGIVGLL